MAKIPIFGDFLLFRGRVIKFDKMENFWYNKGAKMKKGVFLACL